MLKPATLLLLLAAAAVAKKSAKLVNVDGGEKQTKVLELFSRLGTDDVYNREHQPFPYDDPNLFVEQEALKNFSTYWNEGFLDKDGVYTMTCSRTLRDTASLYNLFYYARDFETFYKVAKWAKGEVNPRMYLYALLSAISSRKDTVFVITPPIFEVLPNYFVPASVLNQAFRAKLNGVQARKFMVNNTGWEWSWHSGWGMTSPLAVHQNDWKYYDVESKLSYYREDVTRLDFILKTYIILGNAVPSVVQDTYRIDRLGEIRYFVLNWILTRYNLERYAVGLPPVRSIDLDEPLEAGYDSQLVNLYGRPIPGRPDFMIPREIDPDGVDAVKRIARRFYDVVDALAVRNVTEGRTTLLEDIDSYHQLGIKLLQGNNRYYPALYFNLLALVDGMVTSSNRVEYSTGTLMNGFTMLRDPAYYQILAYISNFFKIMDASKMPYTKEELAFPGVKITSVDISKLETYFEYYDYDISSAVPGPGNGKYIASQFRLNQKPFTFTMTITSDRETQGVVKIYIGPATDVLNFTLGLNKLRESLAILDDFVVKLKPGENVINTNPGQNSYSKIMLRTKDIYQRIQDGQINDDYLHCYYPNNLILPKGSKTGKPYKFYFVVYPYGGPQGELPVKPSCTENYLTKDLSHSLFFPVNRVWVKDAIEQDNHKIIHTHIYHTDIPVLPGRS